MWVSAGRWDAGCGMRVGAGIWTVMERSLEGGAVGWQDARLSDELRGTGGFEAGGRGQTTRLRVVTVDASMYAIAGEFEKFEDLQD